ncbi:MAG: prepilin-type N-terminal cleavage/methylation domain-containing protein [Planctomycetes bacterium]|nr:prepilin-type N-terminal cleavage/methylation domain-containing protein [Planctomycetota bacterium]
MKHGKHGFTVVELLTAITIIAILIAILLPSANMVRRVAKESAQKARLANIALALTAFRNDYGDYPPSDMNSSAYTGAQMLSEALLGWDLLGFHPESEWKANGGGKYPTTNLEERRGRYLELATANAFNLGQLFNAAFDPNTFVLCDTFGVRKTTVNNKSVKAGTPILYYRADTSTKVAADIYDYTDNSPLIALDKVKENDSESDVDHALTDPNFYSNGIGGIYDSQITIDWPYRPDSYILISAGADGLYGTRDDITNF